MKKLLATILLLLPLLAFGRNVSADSAWVLKNYTKKDVYVTMRDGVRLYTALYLPKDKRKASAPDKPYAVLCGALWQ